MAMSASHQPEGNSMKFTWGNMQWDSFCGRKDIETDNYTINTFGMAICCSMCYEIFLARRSWEMLYG
jgi:hypothetical protein